jgi:hypothetical protein
MCRRQGLGGGPGSGLHWCLVEAVMGSPVTFSSCASDTPSTRGKAVHNMKGSWRDPIIGLDNRSRARRAPSCLRREAPFRLIRAVHLPLDGGDVRA